MLFAQLLIAGYGFVVGACVGSFLNVVVWRLPQGLSLLRPASFCPRCKTPIRPRDNVPVLGWLLLRGKCRTCGAPIAPRYPLVEFATGVIFALLAYWELALGGANLPDLTIPWRPIAAGLPFDWTLLCIWLYHCALISLLATVALWEWDNVAPRWRFLLFAFCAGVIPSLLLPELRPSPRQMQTGFSLMVNSLRWGLTGLAVGAAVGAMLGWFSEPDRARRKRTTMCLATALGITGLFLGKLVLPVLCVMAPATLLLSIARGIALGWLLPVSSLVPVIALGLISLWRHVFESFWWVDNPGYDRRAENLTPIIVLCSVPVLFLLNHVLLPLPIPPEKPASHDDDARAP